VLTSVNIVVILKYCFSSYIRSMFIVVLWTAGPFCTRSPFNNHYVHKYVIMSFRLCNTSFRYCSLNTVSILVLSLQVLGARRTSTNALVTCVKIVERVWIKWMHLAASVRLDLPVNFLFGYVAYSHYLATAPRCAPYTTHYVVRVLMQAWRYL